MRVSEGQGHAQNSQYFTRLTRTLTTRATTSATDRLARIDRSHRIEPSRRRRARATRDFGRTSARVSRVSGTVPMTSPMTTAPSAARVRSREASLFSTTPRATARSMRGVPRPLRRDVSRRRARGTRANASEGDEEANSQELCRAEIPTHLPRADFVKQMYRWATSEFEEGGLSRYGKRMSVECVNEFEGGDTNGVMVRLYDFRDGKEVEIAQLIAKMDKEKVQVWDTIVPTKDGGIEKMNRDGKDKFIDGRFFVVSRPLPADESANSALKAMIKRLMLAINAYYSFGSPFAEDF